MARPHAKRWAVMATGGYGRGEMAPFSDVDLLFVQEKAQDESQAEIEADFIFVMGFGPQNWSCHTFNTSEYQRGKR